MTRKHYEEIAKGLRKIGLEAKPDNVGFVVPKVVNVLAKVFIKDNPRFDEDVFNTKIFG